MLKVGIGSCSLGDEDGCNEKFEHCYGWPKQWKQEIERLDPWFRCSTEKSKLRGSWVAA